MKRNTIIVLLAVAIVAVVIVNQVFAQSDSRSAAVEYATIRWAGRDIHVVGPAGQVEFIGQELKKIGRPERVDDRAFYMNLAMNRLAKEGYEFAGMTSDEIVMKRRLVAAQ
jgi:hypothetical protein